MPRYDYICSECGHVFEEDLRIAEKDIPKGNPCPSCGAHNTVDSYLGNAQVNFSFPVGKDKKNALNSPLNRIKNFHKGSTIEV